MLPLKPKRLNLAIASRCFVACQGCYTYFGKREPDLDAITRTVESFVHLGIDEVTISGGDPLTLTGLDGFLSTLRLVGVRTIKVDTVGTGLLDLDESESPARGRLNSLLESIDYLGIPLDGWSNASSALFRVGRASLFDETVSLLNAMDEFSVLPNVVINTVAHRGNLSRLSLILNEVASHRSVCQWNVFQYTPTDQVPQKVNQSYEIEKTGFHETRKALLPAIRDISHRAGILTIDFRTVESRLGEYLLINSDGKVWMPDEHGRTIHLGYVFEREQEVLELWSDLVIDLRSRVLSWPRSGSWQYVVQNRIGAAGAECSL